MPVQAWAAAPAAQETAGAERVAGELATAMAAALARAVGAKMTEAMGTAAEDLCHRRRRTQESS